MRKNQTQSPRRALRRGPVIVQEFDATILVPPGFVVMVDDNSNIVMTQPG